MSDRATPGPLDHVNRKFRAPRPNVLWVSDFTCVATRASFVYVALVIGAYARPRRPARVEIGARGPRARCAGAGTARASTRLRRRAHPPLRSRQYVSIKHTERLAEAGLVPSVGSVGDGDDNALAETINGLHKAELIHRRGPWHSLDAVEYATLDWLNNRRRLPPIGNVPPAEAEAADHASLEEPAASAASLKPNSPR